MKLSLWLHAVAILLAAMLAGCPGASQPASAPARGGPTRPTQPLTLLVVDDAELGKAIASHWRSRTEEDLNVVYAGTAEVTAASRLPCDAIIFPAGFIGQLAENKLIVPLDNAALAGADFDARDIFDQIRLREMKWGAQTLASPLGSPQLLFAYRADIFERLALAPPADWAAYQRIAERLAGRQAVGDLAPANDEPWSSTVEPLAAGYAGQLLLARAAAYALDREQVSPLFRFDNMQPLIDQPPFARALDELVAAAKAGRFSDKQLTPQEAVAELVAGRAAMAVGWPLPGPTATKAAATPGRILFAVLPGSEQSYSFAKKRWHERSGDESWHMPLLAASGRMAAVSASAADPRRAQGFVLWLAGREMSQHVAPHSSATALFRSSHIASASRWAGGLSTEASRSYAESLAQTLSSARAFPGVTLPGRLDYLAALDKAVIGAVQGEASSRAALDAATSEWNAITGRLGVDRQRQANARSLGQAE